jgi:hypothetical protein
MYDRTSLAGYEDIDVQAQHDWSFNRWCPKPGTSDFPWVFLSDAIRVWLNGRPGDWSGWDHFYGSAKYEDQDFLGQFKLGEEWKMIEGGLLGWSLLCFSVDLDPGLDWTAFRRRFTVVDRRSSKSDHAAVSE